MLIPEYYDLSEAAMELGCTKDYLKHLAANRKARIHVLTGGRASWGTYYFDEHDRLVEFRESLPNICLVPYEYWARREAEEDCQLNSLTSINSKNMPNGIGDVLYSAPFYDCTDKIIEFTKFVILRDELERLKQVTQDGLKLKAEEAAPAIQNEMPWLIADPKDPPPEQPWYTPARYFARQLVITDSTLLTKRDILANKVVQSLTNADIKKRGGKKPFDPNTILKAFSNVSLG